MDGYDVEFWTLINDPTYFYNNQIQSLNTVEWNKKKVGARVQNNNFFSGFPLLIT